MMLTTASKVNAAKRYARNGQYPEAAVIAEKIRFSKVSSIHELSALASIFLRVKQYDEAKAVYLEMYSRAKTHKVMVGLIDLCLKTQEPKLAEKFLREFRKMEPENPERLVFRYRVDCMLGKSNEYLLKSLTKLKEEDYTDIWALELAKIYFKENDMVACAKECRDILLWFPDSEVVPKAKVLLGACEDIFEEAEAEPEEAAELDAADALQERAASGASVDVVEITNSESLDSETPRSYEAEAELALEASIADAIAGMLDGAAEECAAEQESAVGAQTIPTPAPVLYDRILYDDDDDEDDEEEYVIRDYFVENAEPLPTEEAEEAVAAQPVILNEASAEAEPKNANEAPAEADAAQPVNANEAPAEADAAQPANMNEAPAEAEAAELENANEAPAEAEAAQPANMNEAPVGAEETQPENVNEAPAEAEAAEPENVNEAPAEDNIPAEPEELQQDTAENLSAETIEEEPLPVIELPVIGVPIEEPFAGETERTEPVEGEAPVGEPIVSEEPSERAADKTVPDLSQIRVEELVFDPDSSAWEEPDDGLLRDDEPEKWMQEVDITANETEPPKEEREASERELTEAALAAMFREDDVAIERALYDLLKKD